MRRAIGHAVQNLKRQENCKRWIERHQQPAGHGGDTAGDQQRRRPHALHDEARPGEERDLGGDADGPQHAHGDGRDALVAPMQRAEGVERRVCALDRPGRHEEQQKDRRAQQPARVVETRHADGGWFAARISTSFRTGGETGMGQEVRRQRRQAGPQDDHPHARCSPRARDHRAARERRRHERHRAPQPHAPVVEPAVAHTRDSHRLDQRHDGGDRQRQHDRDQQNAPEAG